MVQIRVKPGTDTRYPSVKVEILGQPEVEMGTPDKPKPSTVRRVALVFDKGESQTKRRAAIFAEVTKYIKDHGRPLATGESVELLGNLNVSTPRRT